MTMRSKTTLLASALLLAFGAAAQQGMPDQGMLQEKGMQGRMNPGQIEKMTGTWPKASREAVRFMADKYGPPAALTADVAVWGKTGPWKRSIVFREEVPHRFPGPHTDVLQQWIDYKVPTAMYDEMAMYDGSVVLERTSGEMSARCDKEGANFLALNLAHELANGKITLEKARTKYGEQIKAMMAKQPAPYTEKLLFGSQANTRDPDQALPGM